jgi:hypothetical protein
VFLPRDDLDQTPLLRVFVAKIEQSKADRKQIDSRSTADRQQIARQSTDGPFSAPRAMRGNRDARATISDAAAT